MRPVWGDTAKFGRVAVKILIFYFFTTAVAVALGLVAANVLHPGSGIDLIPEGLEAKEVVAPTLSQTLLNIIPINPVEAMSANFYP